MCFFILGEAHVGPFMKGPLKGADILIPQKVGHVGKGERRVAQILFCQEKAGMIQLFLEGRPFIGKKAPERSPAQSKLLGYQVDGAVPPGKRSMRALRTRT